MTPVEQGYLLLCCPLGQRGVRPLTVAQFRELSRRVRTHPQKERGGDVTEQVLLDCGYDIATAQHICYLFSRGHVLDSYLVHCAKLGIFPIARTNPQYPKAIWKKWGDKRPPVYFAAGDVSLWNTPSVAVVGTRNPTSLGREFAMGVGAWIGNSGHTLVTGGAEGVDSLALAGCEQVGGKAVIFVPDRLERRLDLVGKGNLVVSLDGFDLPFSTARAHQRNNCIHSLADMAVVVGPRYGIGGTWQGASENLKQSWSRLLVYKDGSRGANALIADGGTPIDHWNQLEEID